MESKAKKIIVISSGVVLVIAIFIWYLFPILMFKWFWYQNDILQQWLSVTPVPIVELEAPPVEWEDITIGNFTAKLPMSEFINLRGKDTNICFSHEYGSICLFINNSIFPSVSYQDRLNILKSTPNDISFFNSRKINLSAAENQVLKAISIPNECKKGVKP